MYGRSFGYILQASPCIRFSKEGALLAVATSENGIKILANAEGIRLMRYVKRAGATSKVKKILSYISDVRFRNIAMSFEFTNLSLQARVIGTFGASGSAGGSSVVADRSSPMSSVIKMVSIELFKEI